MRKGHRNCSPHTQGVDPAAPKTYDPECPKCVSLKAEGRRTGDEPRPATMYQGRFRGGMQAQYSEAMAKRAKQQEGR